MGGGGGKNKRMRGNNVNVGEVEGGGSVEEFKNKQVDEVGYNVTVVYYGRTTPEMGTSPPCSAKKKKKNLHAAALFIPPSLPAYRPS